jgi:hypothetical protein
MLLTLITFSLHKNLFIIFSISPTFSRIIIKYFYQIIMVAHLNIITTDDDETFNHHVPSPTHHHLSFSLYYSNDDTEQETVPSMTTSTKSMTTSAKRHAINHESCKTFDSDSPRTPKQTSKRAHPFAFDQEEWSFYNLAPKRSQKLVFDLSDEYLERAPRLPFLTNHDNDICAEETTRTTFPLSPFRRDVMAQAPRFPYLDEVEHSSKENQPPILLPRIERNRGYRSCLEARDDVNSRHHAHSSRRELLSHIFMNS